MYLARVSVGPRKTAEHKRLILKTIEQAFQKWANVDHSEIFMHLNEHEPSDFRLNKKFIGNNSSQLVLIQLSFSSNTENGAPHSENPASELFSEITNSLNERAGISKNDVLITLVEFPGQVRSSGIATFNWLSLAPRPVFKPRAKSNESSLSFGSEELDSEKDDQPEDEE